VWDRWARRLGGEGSRVARARRYPTHPLWPQPANGELNLDAKNKLDDKLHELVCGEKKLTLNRTQSRRTG
jgi:hypothetical protein